MQSARGLALIAAAAALATAGGCRTAPLGTTRSVVPSTAIASALAREPRAAAAKDVVGATPAGEIRALNLGDAGLGATSWASGEVVAVGLPADDAPAAPGAGTPSDLPQTLPPTVVTAPREQPYYVPEHIPSTGRLNERVGPNNQPVWTTQRRFPTTRAYVLAPWQVEFESWWEGKFRKDGTERHRYLEELEFGLPGRFQFDFYWKIEQETGEETRWSDFQVEGRWALAPWDCIPLNPTLYGEYKFMEGDEPEAWEAKLLLADDIGSRWQWAVNFFYEKQTSGAEEIEMGASAGLSYALFDPCLTVGIEAKYERTTAIDSRDDPEIEVLVGPSIQWHPTRRIHIDIAPLFGVTEDSPDMQIWVVFGFDLWPGTSAHSVSAPSSTRGR